MRYDRKRKGKHNNGRHWHESSEGNMKHIETLRMEWSDGRIPLTLRAVLWLQRLEQSCELRNEVTSVIFWS